MVGFTHPTVPPPLTPPHEGEGERVDQALCGAPAGGRVVVHHECAPYGAGWVAPLVHSHVSFMSACRANLNPPGREDSPFDSGCKPPREERQ
jgi:hypothetical protein